MLPDIKRQGIHGVSLSAVASIVSPGDLQLDIDVDSISNTSDAPDLETAMLTAIAANKKKYFLDPQYDGVDFTAIYSAEKIIKDLKMKCVLPREYSVHSEIQLLGERVIDTTNRNTIMWAQQDGFDRDGESVNRGQLVSQTLASQSVSQSESRPVSQSISQPVNQSIR